MAPAAQWMKGLTPEMVQRAEDELGETPQLRKQSLKELKELINGQKTFCPVMDDSFLLRFLRCKKYDVKKAFITLKNYHDFKNRYSGTITDRTPSKLKNVLEMDCVFLTPKRGPNGEGVAIVFLGKFDIENLSAFELYAATFLCADIGIETEASQVCGGALIFDFQGITLNKLRHFSNPSYLACLVRGIQNCFPYRIPGFHMVHEPSYFSMTYSIVKPMLSKKLKERVHFHGNDLSSLHKFYPPEILPKELGGHLGEKEFEEFRTYILSKESFIEKLNKYVYNGHDSFYDEEENTRRKIRLQEENLKNLTL
ncbi:alpha-tocopherol transfer protein-like [Parasteatoda tepidariorum]|uniref:alpha-tocopherol transfer protein-like n=1 Tax=Parasteatoda tepidariorum TaxID=114398 RepID=UPI001C71E3AF|nr:alpha-tocopherol transfer protein-like [Parasteatoda tepidariorum]